MADNKLKVINEDDFEGQFNRTIVVVEYLAGGKTLKVGEYKIGMGSDMSIGFMHTRDGIDYVDGLSTMDLRQLNEVLNDCSITLPLIPF